MTVRELKEQLDLYNDSLPVAVRIVRKCGYRSDTYGNADLDIEPDKVCEVKSLVLTLQEF